MTWGKGIAFTLLAFVLMISSLVYRSTKQNFSLVEKNYYEESLDHDAKQLKRSNFSALGDDIKIQYLKEEEIINIFLPNQFEEKDIEGTIQFYHPSNHKMDRIVKISEAITSVPTTELRAGMWKVNVEWTAIGKTYLAEKVHFIN